MAGGTGTRESGAGGEADVHGGDPDFGFVPRADSRAPDANFCLPNEADEVCLGRAVRAAIRSRDSALMDSASRRA